MTLDTLRREVASLTKEVAELDAKISAKTKDLHGEEKAESQAKQRASRTTSATTARSAASTAARHQKKAADLREDIANIGKKKAARQRTLATKQRSLDEAEKRSRSVEDRVAEKRRKDEIRHLRQVRNETERITSLQRNAEPLRVITRSRPLPSRITVLMMSADPQDADRLRLGDEARTIDEEIRKAEHRDSINFETMLAAQPLDVLDGLNRYKPTVLHVSGHGTPDGLVFQTERGEGFLVPGDAFAGSLALAPSLRLIVLNACYSSRIAEMAVAHVEAAIGMDVPISDEAARHFSRGLYMGLGAGRNLDDAFAHATTALRLLDIPETQTPSLLTADGVDPSEICLVAGLEPRAS